ncbi:MAG: bifunctional adenosylcobinamide kinase/adenosylcobinamide-phosphate guanylyltransferase [Firmicutes bacterium]|nr:bifunctional adenosylcobinamide kinase/adenosylcobinamide-phosphate guanylyltransferase [Bacillota bacterium]
MAGKVILVTGGARSGKSEVAEQLAAGFTGPVIYLATAGVCDEEMKQRVHKHRERRPAHWVTVEETQRLTMVLEKAAIGSCVLVDCLTLWLTNLLLDESPLEEKEILAELARLIETARSRDLTLILVSNQVGCGVVPENRLARLFRDLAGLVNRQAAAQADLVYLVTAGIPVELKALAAQIGGEDI